MGCIDVSFLGGWCGRGLCSDGELLEVAPPDVDVSKVIEYPGFTTEPPMGCIDVSF